MINFKDSVVVFTDGACSGNPGPGGWAVVVCWQNKWVIEDGGFVPATTNNRMEMAATLSGLRLAKSKKDLSTKTIHILTDSTYVLNGATKWVFGWKKRGWMTADNKPVSNQDLWEELDSMITSIGRTNIEWHYVRGHAGIPGNERVDEIAVQFSKGEHSSLYNGAFAPYQFDLQKIPDDTSIPELKDRKSEPGKVYFYLSLVDGKVLRHTTWAECEARVKGRPGVRFKKVSSETEAADVLKSWGARE